MRPASIRKLLALSSFILLISLFVLYRSGGLGSIISPNTNPVQTSPNGGAVNNTTTDTTRKGKTDSVERLRMPSSKLLVLTDEPRLKSRDKKKNKPDSTTRERPVRMPGSKSGLIVDRSAFKADTTLKKDSATLKQRP